MKCCLDVKKSDRRAFELESQSNLDHIVQILLIGDTGVGKSSLIARYAQGEFSQGLIGTAGIDHKEMNIEHMSKGIKLRLWDTAGQERFRETSKNYFRRAVGIILVFDVTDKRSFDNIDYWLGQIEENAERGTEIILIGNKIDLVNEVAVTEKEAMDIAVSHGIHYFATSAKDSTNLDEAIKFLLTTILENQELQERIEFSRHIRLEEMRRS